MYDAHEYHFFNCYFIDAYHKPGLVANGQGINIKMGGATHILIYLTLISTTTAKETFRIAGIVSTDENGRALEDAVKRANADMPPNLELQSLYIKMDANPIRSALNLCDHIISQGVHTVIVSKPENSDISPPISVSYTCGFYSIPVIGISARDSSFSDMVRLLHVITKM